MTERPPVAPTRSRSGGAADAARFVTMGVSGIATFGLVGYFGVTERAQDAESPATTATSAAPTSIAPAAVPVPSTAVPLTTLLPAAPTTLAPTTIPATTLPPPPPPAAVPPPPPPVAVADVVTEQSE